MDEPNTVLRNGRVVHLRPIEPADGPALRIFHTSLSDRTVYFRFFSSKQALSDADVAYFTEVDHRDRVALVAIDDDELIGVCRYDIVGDDTAEVAFVIRDDHQGLGLGSTMLHRLAVMARNGGVRTFTAEVLPDNIAMLKTFESSGFPVTLRRGRDAVILDLDITTST
ncbi:MAG: GNAT family N-acetyltransferase [bacterium]|nr:GNAT family N-acetyltransferase [bacterium]